MQAPERFTMWSCIGCGAMGTDQPCLGPCDDHALDLVRATEHDAVVAHVRGTREGSRPLLELVRELADAHDAAAYRALRERARSALHEAGDAADVVPGEPFRAWLCTGCGRVEAPQACLGVCLRHPEDVVRADRHAEALARAADADRDARALRALVRRLAWTTPREGHGDETVAAMRAAALALVGGVS
jgi:hypothetical protein